MVSRVKQVGFLLGHVKFVHRPSPKARTTVGRKKNLQYDQQL